MGKVRKKKNINHFKDLHIVFNDNFIIYSVKICLTMDHWSESGENCFLCVWSWPDVKTTHIICSLFKCFRSLAYTHTVRILQNMILCVIVDRLLMAGG